ncbi:hypothetical protein C8R45DRAFT_989270 [Mycena sanguinolenta]|nr:hypothetical protein C8R45DRAFT_989270 [Mycena sanguinolenta]
MTRFFRSPAPVSCVPLRVDAAGAGTQTSVMREFLRLAARRRRTLVACSALRCGLAGRTSCKLMASFVGVGATRLGFPDGPRAPGHLHDASRCARSSPAPAGVRYVSRLRPLQCAGACCSSQTLAPCVVYRTRAALVSQDGESGRSARRRVCMSRSSSAPCPHFPPTRPYLQPSSSSPAARASSTRRRRDVHCHRANQVARSLGMRRYI